MPRPLPPIHECEDELLSLLETLHDRERRIRIHALFLAKKGYCRTRYAIAQALQRDRKTVERWFAHYEQDGLQALLGSRRQHCGKKPRIPDDVLTQLDERLGQPEGFHGYQSICSWLQKQFALEIPYKTVYGTVHYRLHATPKVPRKSNVKKDSQGEDTFKKNVCA